MTFPRRTIQWLWLLLALGAVVFVAVCTLQRVRHITWVTAQAGGSEVQLDPESPTGYASGLRPLVAPERDARGLQWILQTQEMRARGAWRLDRADYDNAPAGREIWLPSPYRWWLTGVGALEAQFSGLPRGAAIERAALWADPLLQVLLILVAGALVWRWAGAAPAAIVALGMATVFPFGAAFLPGRPDEFGWALACAVLSVLPILGSIVGGVARRVQVRFVFAGLATGLGLWIAPAVHLPLLWGVVLGGAAWAALQARAMIRGDDAAPQAPVLAWRTWAITAAVVVLVGWWTEGRWEVPGLLAPRWDAVQPLHALACLGAGELLARLDAWGRRGRAAWSWPALLSAAGGCAALLASGSAASVMCPMRRLPRGCWLGFGRRGGRSAASRPSFRWRWRSSPAPSCSLGARWTREGAPAWSSCSGRCSSRWVWLGIVPRIGPGTTTWYWR